MAALLLFAPATYAQADSVKTAVIKVTNLHCNNDMPTIKKRLLNNDGIDEVTYSGINGETSVFTIVYHTSVTSQEQIEKAIETTPGCDDKNSTPYRVRKENGRKKKAHE
ncbi:hypothetical protein GCM10023093_13530 [Nemorincola caseinilytica]|uniref:HMA domain-containing protein n=2 Tax=Nemorincola caseinilytica TaxID=2054315 RepID=A0ABP8NAD9_9BACT